MVACREKVDEVYLQIDGERVDERERVGEVYLQINWWRAER